MGFLDYFRNKPEQERVERALDDVISGHEEWERIPAPQIVFREKVYLRRAPKNVYGIVDSKQGIAFEPWFAIRAADISVLPAPWQPLPAQSPPGKRVRTVSDLAAADQAVDDFVRNLQPEIQQRTAKVKASHAAHRYVLSLGSTDQDSVNALTEAFQRLYQSGARVFYEVDCSGLVGYARVCVDRIADALPDDINPRKPTDVLKVPAEVWRSMDLFNRAAQSGLQPYGKVELENIKPGLAARLRYHGLLIGEFVPNVTSATAQAAQAVFAPALLPPAPTAARPDQTPGPAQAQDTPPPAEENASAVASAPLLADSASQDPATQAAPALSPAPAPEVQPRRSRRSRRPHPD